MDSARPGDPFEFLSYEEAAQKLAVSVVELKIWEKQSFLKPLTTPEGNFGYTQSQLIEFKKNNPSFFQSLETSNNMNGGMPGRAANVVGNKKLRHVGTSSDLNPLQKFSQWLGGKYYSDEFADEYNNTKNSKFSPSDPYVKKSLRMAMAVLLVALIAGVFSMQQSLVKSANQSLQPAFKGNNLNVNEPSVLGAQTSKLKLIGNITFRLPVTTQQVFIGKTLEVAGKSVFKSAITAPNVLYGIKAGQNVIITDESSQTPTISVSVPTPIAVTSFQGLTGPVTLQQGSNISISGTTISDTSTLAKLAADGSCSTCILASEVAQNLTIDSGGSVNASAINSGLLTTSVGGTGLSSYNAGDLLYAESSNTLAALPVGTANGEILQVSNGLPAWTTVPLNAPGSSSNTSGASLIGVYSGGFTHSAATDLQTVLADFDNALSNAGVSPFLVGNDNVYGNYIYPTTASNSFVLGGNATPEGSSLFFNAGNANLTVGTSGTTNGTLTLGSSGSSNPNITTNANGNLLIQNTNVGIDTTPTDQDASNNPFVLEVHGSIGPDENGVFDLGSPTRKFRNLYITGQTTSGGNITISNPAPEITFIETNNGNYTYNISTTNDTYSVTNGTTNTTGFAIDSNGDIQLAGGSGATGCTVTAASGDFSCAGSINGATITNGNLSNIGNVTASGTITLSGLTNNGPVYTTAGGILNSETTLTAAQGGTGVNGSAAPNGNLLVGNGSGFSLAGITGTANQVTVTNGAGTITLSLPQDINTTSSPSFASENLTNTTNQLSLGANNANAIINADAQTAPTTVTIPQLTGADTFVLANQTQTLNNKTIGTTGLTFANAATNISSTGNANLTISAGTGAIVLNSLTQLPTIEGIPANALALCVDTSNNNIAQCPANAGGTTLQLAYESGNSISASDAFGNIALTLASGSSRQLTLTNSGSATSAFVINTPAVGNQNALTVQENGSPTLAIDETGALTTASTITSQATINQLVLGTTNTTTISSLAPLSSVIATIPALAASDTFVFANQAQTLNNKTIGSSGLTFSGATPDITTGTNENLTVAPNGSGQIILSNTTQLGSLPGAGASATTLCRDNSSNQITACPANALNVSLQQAYQAGNAISATDQYGNIALTLANNSSRALTLTNSGTASAAFVINTPAAGNQNALAVQQNGNNTLTIDENGNLTTAGTVTLNGSTPEITTGTNQNLSITPNGSGQIVLGTTTQLSNLPGAGASATTLCRDSVSDEITACPANALNVTLQQAYQAGNTISATDQYGNIAFTLANGSSRALTLTNSGTASAALVINTPAAGSQNAIAVQQNGNNTLTIDENGNLSTAGNISTSNAGTITSNGLLTASNGFTLTSGALNLTGTSGSLALSGLNASSINTGTNNLTITSNNFNTTATGINSTAIGATIPSTASFTTLAANSTVTLSSFNAAGVVTNASNGVLSTVAQLGVTEGGTGVNASSASNGELLIGNGTGFSLAGITGTANQVNVTNGSGTITLSLPQDIATTSSPTFASLTATNTTNQLVLGTTNTTTISSLAPLSSVIATIPALAASDTFVFANQAQTLNNKTIGSSGLTFSGATPDITTGTNENLTVAPNGSGQIILSNTTQLGSLPGAGASATTLCRDDTSDQITACPANASNVTLQQAYQAGNTISATDQYGNIALTLANNSSRALTLTNSGTASAAFVINTPAAGNQNALAVQQNGNNTLTIDENGNLTTAGTITSSETLNQLVLGTTNTTTINAAIPSSSVIASIPALSANDTFVFANQIQTLTNKNFIDNSTIFENAADNTKQFEFNASQITTGTLQTISIPNESGTLCLTTGNCAGSGGVVGGSGTQYSLAEFTTTGSEIGNSSITDNGSFITANEPVNIGSVSGTPDTLTLLRIADATSGTQTQSSSPLTLQGAYWNGSASNTLGFSLQNQVLSTAPSYQLAFLNDSSAQVAALSNAGNFSLAATTNQLVLGTTNTTTISSLAPLSSVIATIPALAASDTFVFANQAQTLNNKTIGSSGLTFSGATPDITTGTNENLTVAPNGSGQIILSNTTQLGSLPGAGASATTLCRDNSSNQITACPANASNVTLQQAYQAGNAISATDQYGNIALTLANNSSRALTLTNSGTASAAFVINTPAAGNQNALAVQQNAINTLTIDEAGDLATSGTIATSNTTASTNPTTGALTVAGGAGINGALNVGSTFGVTGATTLSSTLGVTGLATFNGGATITSGQNLNLPGFTPGSITFVNSSNQLAQNNSSLFWDQTNQGLGIGTNSVLPSAGLTVSKESLGNATVAINQVGLGPIFTASSSGTTRFTIDNAGDLLATGQISGLTGYSQSSGNFAQSGGGTFSTGTGAVSLNGNTSVTGANTFTVGTGTTTLGGALGVTGLATFNGGATVASNQTLTALGASTFTPNTNNSVVINTNPTNSSFLQLNGLATEPGTTLCVDSSNNVAECNGAPFGLQAAYNTGNTITTTTGRNIAFTLYNQSSDSGTATSFTLTNNGTAPAFILNTPALGTQNALSIQQNAINTLTIDEAGDLVTSGTIATSNTTASTNPTTGALTVAGGAGINGALNVGSTFGVTGATTLSSTLGVTGLATFNGGATITSGQNLNLPGFTPGSITFVNSSNQLAQNNSSLFWDQTNQGLGIGTNSVLPSAGLTVSKESLGNATVAINQVGLGPIFTASSSSITRFTIDNAGDLLATGAISGLTGYSQSSGNFAQSGGGTFSTGTGAISLNGNTSVTGANTFTVGTGTTTLGGALGVTGATTLSSTVGVTGLATFNGGATIASGQTLTANGQSTFSPNGSTGVTINTTGSNFLSLTGLTTPGSAGTPLCLNGSSEVTQCSANSITLQSAYNGGNTITTNSGSNIAFTLASGLATPTSFTLTNAGTAPAFVINTPALGTQNALSIQQNAINTLTIDEAGDLATSGTIATSNTTASTTSSTGAVTVAGGEGINGALNVGSTLGVTGNTNLGGTLGVTGATTLSSSLGVTGTHSPLIYLRSYRACYL